MADSHVIDGMVNGAGWTAPRRYPLEPLGKWIIDGVRVNGPAIISGKLSYPARLLQWGLVQWYALVMVIGLLGFVFY